MIPSFPKFKKFQIEDRKDIEQLIKTAPPYCEYSLVALLTWNGIELAMLNNNLVMKLSDYYDDHTPEFSVYGTTDIDKTLHTILKYTKKNKYESTLVFVPEHVVNAIRSSKDFICREDRDHFDYIVSTEEMATLKGGRNQTKRELFKSFSKQYQGYRWTILDLKNKIVQNEIKYLYDTWRRNISKEDGFLDYEYEALIKLYPFADDMNIISHGMYYDSLLTGFSIVGLVNKPYAIHYYMKTDIRYRGITVTCNKLLGEYLFNHDYLFLNLEADRGVLGLRNSKILRHPIELLKKYKIRLA